MRKIYAIFIFVLGFAYAQYPLQQLEEAELNKTLQAIYREEALELYRQKLKPSVTVSGDKVAFLGNSSNPLLEEGWDPDILSQLLEQIKLQKPKALFFMGNLIWSLKLDGSGKEVNLPSVYDSLGNISYQPSGFYSSDYFRSQLAKFSELLKKHLGSEIAFYPILGESETIAPDAVKLFLEQFPIPNSVVLDSSQLVYHVSIGAADFAVMSLPIYGQTQYVTPPLLKWLDTTLEGSKYPWLFAVGSVPAFSTGGALGAYAGLDRDRNMRTQFWQVLMRHKVLAYFCSNEALFDRSYRYGVWQIISGGGGAEYDLERAEQAFHHFLLLTIPEKRVKSPTLQVIDVKGKKRAEEALSSQIPAIYQFRE